MVRIGTAAVVLALMATPLFAQESTEQLKKELEQLRAEVDGLKAVNHTREIPATGAADVDAMAADDSPVMTLFKQTKLSGFVDVSYNYSLRGRGTPTNPLSYTGRVFDVAANTFALQALQINLERLATKDMIVGYHAEIAAGVDPFIYNGGGVLGLGALVFGSNLVALQEAWLQILAPIGNGLDIRVGKMATLAGYEVIESMNNMNFSRGLLYGFAIPFTHTGVRVNYSFAEQANVTLGFNNGWNTNFDFNNGKTVEFQLQVKPVKDLTVNLTSYWGSEPLAGGAFGQLGASRFLMDLVVEYKMDKLTAALEFDWGVQANSGFAANPAWGGAALFVKYQLMDIFAPSLRIEYFSEGFGRRFYSEGFGLPSSALHGTPSRTIEFTLTGEFKIGNSLILRLEFRHDDCNVSSFITGSYIGNQNGQDSIAVEAIMPF